MTEVTVGIDSQAACLVDGPTDDYEGWNGEIAEELLEEKAVLYAHCSWVPRGSRLLTPHSGSTELKPPLLKAAKL